MTIMKRILLALFISCSMVSVATYSSIASAELRPNGDVVNDVLKSLNSALASINEGKEKEVVLAQLQDARQFSKEINVGSLGAIVDRGSDAVLRAKRNVKQDNKEGSIEAINDAIAEYTEMGKRTL